jgi:hypothetical protein
MSPNR